MKNLKFESLHALYRRNPEAFEAEIKKLNPTEMKDFFDFCKTRLIATKNISSTMDVLVSIAQ